MPVWGRVQNRPVGWLDHDTHGHLLCSCTVSLGAATTAATGPASQPNATAGGTFCPGEQPGGALETKHVLSVGQRKPKGFPTTPSVENVLHTVWVCHFKKPNAAAADRVRVRPSRLAAACCCRVLSPRWDCSKALCQDRMCWHALDLACLALQEGLHRWPHIEACKLVQRRVSMHAALGRN